MTLLRLRLFPKKEAPLTLLPRTWIRCNFPQPETKRKTEQIAF
jgi:hypothetical protein